MSKERCPCSAAPTDTGMSAAEGLALFTPADLQDPNTHTHFFRRRRQAQPDSGGGLTPRNTILPAVGTTTIRQ